ALHEDLLAPLTLVGDLAAAAVHVADDRAEVLRLRHDLELHDRLEQLRSACLVRLAEAGAGRDLEGEGGAVHVVVLAVEEARPEVHDLVARDRTTSRLAFDGLLHGRDVLARNAAADDLVRELDAAAGAER